MRVNNFYTISLYHPLNRIVDELRLVKELTHTEEK